MFLKDDDYKPQIRQWVLNVVTQNDPLAREKAERAAQVEMESYLRSRYNVKAIFSQADDARNVLLVMYLVDMAVYHLHSNISPENIPEIRHLRYKAAIDWLKDVANGRLTPDLPEIDSQGDKNDDSPDFEWGGNKKYSERF